MRSVSRAALLLALTSNAFCAPAKHSELPIVDLGYELHQAINYNATTDAYKFANVRYAQEPTGDLRWRAPRAPKLNRHTIQNGSELRTCAQGVPDWQSRAFLPIGEYTAGAPYNLSGWDAAIAASQPLMLNTTEGADGITEDCLALDIYVPSKIMEKADQHYRSGSGAPVIVWIHGGGLTLGSKVGFPSTQYVPDGLLETAKHYDESGVIFVAINYRLGALGFLSGPEVEKHGDLNAGLLDQRFALEWVQKNIHLFGGSAERVTVLGESGGGSSILMHMVSSKGAPFSQAIAQSPGMNPIVTIPNSVYEDFFSLLKVKTTEEARKLPFSEIANANAAQIKAAPASSYLYGFVKDDEVSEHPAVLFERGDFDKSVNLIVSHNSFEGAFFFDPTIKTEKEFHDLLNLSIPGLTKAQQEDVLNEVYPPKFDGSHGYTDQNGRQQTLWGDAVFLCNYLAVNEALRGKSYSYEFDVTPGIHIQDLSYTFNNPAGAPFVPGAAETLRSAVTSFAINGVPSLVRDGKVSHFPRWGSDKTVIHIGDDKNTVGTNTVNQARCDWWHKAEAGVEQCS